MWGFRMSAKYKLYRFMCKEEFDNTSVDNCFSWNSKAKWFSDDIEFIKSRVGDGGFNNSGFVDGRYDYLIIYDIIDDNDKLKRVSDKEVMLYRKDAPMIKVIRVIKVGMIGDIQFPEIIFGKFLEGRF